GIPVRLFGSWTTLPAGPATLAAKTGSTILPVAIRRNPDGRTFHVQPLDPIEVASAAPADLLAAPPRGADPLQVAIAAAPDQWYSFKPMWPSTPEEAAALERRAAEMAAGIDSRPSAVAVDASAPVGSSLSTPDVA